MAERQRGNRLATWRSIRLPLVALLGWWFVALVVLGRPWIFPDNVNLFLHEGGHLLFRIFGSKVLHLLGGTLTQLLFPVGFGVYFWFWRRDPFASLVMAWWIGQNLVSSSVYMRDAVDTALPTVGGEIHDWGWLYRHFDALAWAVPVSNAEWGLGALLMGASLALLGMIAAFPSDEMFHTEARMESLRQVARVRAGPRGSARVGAAPHRDTPDRSATAKGRFSASRVTVMRWRAPGLQKPG